VTVIPLRGERGVSVLEAMVEILRDMEVYYSHVSHCGSNFTIGSVKII